MQRFGQLRLRAQVLIAALVGGVLVGAGLLIANAASSKSPSTATESTTTTTPSHAYKHGAAVLLIVAELAQHSGTQPSQPATTAVPTSSTEVPTTQSATSSAEPSTSTPATTEPSTSTTASSIPAPQQPVCRLAPWRLHPRHSRPVEPQRRGHPGAGAIRGADTATQLHPGICGRCGPSFWPITISCPSSSNRPGPLTPFTGSTHGSPG